MLLRALVVDNLALISLGFLGLTVLITIGLGVWVMAHLSKKKAS